MYQKIIIVNCAFGKRHFIGYNVSSWEVTIAPKTQNSRIRVGWGVYFMRVLFYIQKDAPVTVSKVHLRIIGLKTNESNIPATGNIRSKKIIEQHQQSGI